MAVHDSPEPSRVLHQALAELPEVGSSFLGFQLIAELGRGSFSRVYLAQQGDLANRFVALKISAGLYLEPQLLAQLQHTNIVPIYSVHQAGPLQAVCMPYFGPTTLADVFEQVQKRVRPPASGKALVEVIQPTLLSPDDQGTPILSRPTVREKPGVPANPKALVAMLEGMSYTRAVLWVGARLADGLAHAHDRGILHRDLKPANVLLSDDGQPMLLDFNLSEDVKRRRGALARRGGTLPYMAPEQLAVFQGGAAAVDARSDLYALGVLLYQLLTGRLPFAVPPGSPAEILPQLLEARRQPPPARPWSREITPAVEAILHRCLQPDPARRYRSAHELREDLQRQLDDLPLRHTPEPSLRERLAKWARRHPRLTSVSSLATVATLLLAAALAPWGWSAWHEHIENARAAQEGERAAQERQHLAEAKVRQEQDERQASKDAGQQHRAFRAALPDLGQLEDKLNLVQLLPDVRTFPEQEITAELSRCRQALTRYRVLEGPTWQRAPAMTLLPEERQAQLRRDVADILYLLARADSGRLGKCLEQARAYGPVPAALSLPAAAAPWAIYEAALHTRAGAVRRYLDLAEACYPGPIPPAAFRAERSTVAELLEEPNGDVRPAGAAEAPAVRAAALVGPPAEAARDLYRAACRRVERGRTQEAVELLREAVGRSATNYSAWFLLAVCHYQLDDFDQAVTCCEVCVRLKPKFPLSYFGRGLVRLGRRDWVGAQGDFDRVLTLAPEFAAAHVHRASAWLGLRRYPEAVRDLSRAVELRPEYTELFFLRAELYKKTGDLPAAGRDLERLLAAKPVSAEGWLTRGLARAGRDPAAALRDFERALELKPRNPLTLYHKARLLGTALGQTREAIAVLDRMVAYYPEHVAARAQRGILLARLGQWQLAHADAEDIRTHSPTGLRSYQAARIYALTARRRPEDSGRALDLLAQALASGYGFDRIAEDEALSALRQTNAFQSLAGAARVVQASLPKDRP
jgi:serine/threonine protein kinase/regulator of sirC expression with transglutaminase-like and TPR domain